MPRWCAQCLPSSPTRIAQSAKRIHRSTSCAQTSRARAQISTASWRTWPSRRRTVRCGSRRRRGRRSRRVSARRSCERRDWLNCSGRRSIRRRCSLTNSCDLRPRRTSKSCCSRPRSRRCASCRSSLWAVSPGKAAASGVRAAPRPPRRGGGSSYTTNPSRTRAARPQACRGEGAMCTHTSSSADSATRNPLQGGSSCPERGLLGGVHKHRGDPKIKRRIGHTCSS
mmetsp:Transcript_70718/g.140161  ORF Transcript_70718/g.140161 Transcript_70718/m.140161 type:complete len:226 (-) Transcript_70718:132-809(-)